MNKEWQDFLTLLLLAAAYPVIPIIAWQQRDERPDLATIVIALWVFIVPVFVIGFGGNVLWSDLSQTITAPFKHRLTERPLGFRVPGALERLSASFST
jgi:hypothetical protein